MLTETERPEAYASVYLSEELVQDGPDTGFEFIVETLWFKIRRLGYTRADIPRLVWFYNDHDTRLQYGVHEFICCVLKE